MIVTSDKDIRGLLRIGEVVGRTLKTMLEAAHPGVTTGELNAIGAELLRAAGAHPAPIVMYQFPAATCISINDEAAHGIPGGRVIQVGDLVNIDVSAEMDGYYADTGATVPMLPVGNLQERLVAAGQTALEQGIAVARAGTPVNAIGKVMEGVAKANGFQMIRDLPGHGVGHKLHEPPTVPGFFNPRLREVLKEGMVLTIEPFVSARARHIKRTADGWTLKTTDGSLAVQYEHTVIITRDNPIILTQVK